MADVRLLQNFSRRKNNYFKLIVFLIVLSYAKCEALNAMKTPDNDYQNDHRPLNSNSDLPTSQSYREPKVFDSDTDNTRQFRDDNPKPKELNSNWRFHSSENRNRNDNRNERNERNENHFDHEQLEEPSYGTGTGQNRPMSNNKGIKNYDDTFESSELFQNDREAVSNSPYTSKEDDSLAKETERNSRGIPSVPGSFGPEPYFFNDDGDDNFGNKGRSNIKIRDHKPFAFDQNKDSRKRNEDIPQKFSLISNPDSFSSIVNQRKSGNSDFRDKHGAQLIKMVPETSRERGLVSNSHSGNVFGHGSIRNNGKEIGNIKSFDMKRFPDNSKTITSHDSRFLSITTVPPFRMVDESKRSSAKNQKDVESILKLLNIKPNRNNNNNNNNSNKQIQNVKTHSFENFDQSNSKFRGDSKQSSEKRKKNSREDISEFKNSKISRDNSVMEFRNDKSRDSQRFGKDLDSEQDFRNNRNRDDFQELRNGRNRDANNNRGDRFREEENEFRNNRNRESQAGRNSRERETQEFRDGRFRDEQSFSKSRNRNSKERFENERSRNVNSRERERKGGTSKDFGSNQHENDSPRNRNRDNDRRNRDYEDDDYDSSNYKSNRDYDSGSNRERDNDSPGFRRGKNEDSRSSRFQDYEDSPGFRKNKESSRNSRRNKEKSKRPTTSRDEDLPPVNFDSLLDSFEERDRGKDFPGKKKSKSQDVDALLDFIHGGNSDKDKPFEIDDFDEIVRNLNDDPNFLSNLGFTFVNASDLLDSGNKKGSKGNRNKEDSPLSLFETLVNLKDPKVKNKKTGNLNFNEENENNREKDQNKQSLSDLLSSFKLNTKPGRGNKKQDSNSKTNSELRVVNKENNLFSTIRPQSFKHVTEGSPNSNIKKPFSLRPTQIPNGFGSSTPGGSFGTTEVTSVFGNGQDSLSDNKNNIPPFRMSQGGAPVFINSTVFVSTTPLTPFLSPIDYIPRLRTPSSLAPNVPGTGNVNGNLPAYTYHVLPGGQNILSGLNPISNKGLFGINNPLVSSRLQQQRQVPGLPTSTLFPRGREDFVPTTTPFPTSPHHSTPFPTSPHHSTPFPSTPRPTSPFSLTPQPTPFSPTQFPGSPIPTTHRPTSPFVVGPPGHTGQFPSTPTTPFSVTHRPVTPRQNTQIGGVHRTTPFSVAPRPTTPFSAIPNPTTPHSFSPQPRVSFPDSHHSSFPTTPTPSQHSPTSPFSIGSNPSSPFSVTPRPITQFASPFPTTFLPGTLNPTSISQFPTTPSPGAPFAHSQTSPFSPHNNPTTPFSPHSFPVSFPNGAPFNQGLRPNALPIVTSETPAKKISPDQRQDLKSLTARGRRLRGKAREGGNKGAINSVPTTVSPTTTSTESSVTLRTVPPNFAVRRRLRKKVRRKKKRVNENYSNPDQLIEEELILEPNPSSLHTPHISQRQEHNRILRKIPIGRSLSNQRESQIVRPGGVNNFISPHDVNSGHINIPSPFVTPTPFGPFVTTPSPFGFPSVIARTTPAPHLRTIAPATLERKRIKQTNPSENKVTALPKGKSITASPRPFVTSTLSPQHSPLGRNVLLGSVPASFPLSRLKSNPKFNAVPSSISSPNSKHLGTPSPQTFRSNLSQKDIDGSTGSIGNLNRLRGSQFPNHLSPYPFNQHLPRVPLTAIPFHTTLGPHLNTPFNQPILVTSPRSSFLNTVGGPGIKVTPGSEPFTATPRSRLRKGTPTPVPIEGTPRSKELEVTPGQDINDISSFNSGEFPNIPKGINPNYPPHLHHLRGIPRGPIPRFPPQGLGPYISPYGPVLFDPRAQNLTHSFVHPSLGLGPSYQGLQSPGSFHGSQRSLPAHLSPGSSPLLYPNNYLSYSRGSIPLGTQQLLAGSPGLGLRKYYLQNPI